MCRSPYRVKVMKEFKRISKLVIGVILTLMSFMVLLMALCTVAITRWAWGGVFALMASIIWLIYIATKLDTIMSGEDNK